MAPVLHVLFCFLAAQHVCCNGPYLEKYTSDAYERNGTRNIYFALILSSNGQFESFGAVAGVKVALNRINKDPFLLQNYTLGYTLTNSTVSQ